MSSWNYYRKSINVVMYIANSATVVVPRFTFVAMDIRNGYRAGDAFFALSLLFTLAIIYNYA